MPLKLAISLISLTAYKPLTSIIHLCIYRYICIVQTNLITLNKFHIYVPITENRRILLHMDECFVHITETRYHDDTILLHNVSLGIFILILIPGCGYIVLNFTKAIYSSPAKFIMELYSKSQPRFNFNCSINRRFSIIIFCVIPIYGEQAYSCRCRAPFVCNTYIYTQIHNIRIQLFLNVGPSLNFRQMSTTKAHKTKYIRNGYIYTGIFLFNIIDYSMHDIIFNSYI